MGKATLIHPVSLYVIRGATAFCGFKFGRIRQKHYDPEFGIARYETVIEKMPKGLAGKSLSELQERLQSCFMDDIRVSWVRWTKSGSLMCDLRIDPRKAEK